MARNDFEPITDLEGQRMTFNFPGFRVGVAEYGPGITGCTVFRFDRKTTTAVDIRGGDPAVSEHLYDGFDAICFAGGSLQGLEVLTGVRAALFEEFGSERDLVTCAAVNDWYKRDRSINPDKSLGYAAYASTAPNQFLLGRHGAGTNVWVGGGKGRGVGQPEQAGQGGAFTQYGPVKLAVFTVINALGAVLNRQGEVVCGNLDPESGARTNYLDGLAGNLAELEEENQPEPRANTTLTLVITNLSMSRHQLRQTARQIHSSLARAIHPFHTIYDGDVLYMASTMEVEEARLDSVSLGLLGAELAWDAAISTATS